MKHARNSGDKIPIGKGEDTASGSLQVMKPLDESKDTFRALAETVSAVICILQDGRFRYVNPAMEEITEYSAAELSSRDFLSLVHPDMKEEIKDLYDKWSADIALDEQYELKGISKSGNVRWVDIRGKTIDYQGRPALLLTGMDITERKQAEKALSESEERLRLCAATAHFGTFDWDMVKDTHYWSPETYEIYGIQPGVPLTFEYIKNFAPLEDVDCSTVKAAMDPAGPGVYTMEFRITRASDRSTRLVYIKGQVYFAGEGPERKPVRVLGVVQDITRFKQAEESAQSAKAQAELYLDLMGHDINNMNQIALGYLELTRDKFPENSQREYLDKSIEVLQRSTHLIKNVRKLQRLRETVLEPAIVDVCAVLADVQREFGAVPNKPITLMLNRNEHCYVRANELLYDLFSNLATNAIKHTGNRANIVMDLDVVISDGIQYCRVIVEDDGPGISDDFKPKVFNRLLRGTTKAKGMGLGLYLVKSLVDNYNGKVWVEDRVLNDHTLGTRFVVILPLVEKQELPG